MLKKHNISVQYKAIPNIVINQLNINQILNISIFGDKPEEYKPGFNAYPNMVINQVVILLFRDWFITIFG